MEQQQSISWNSCPSIPAGILGQQQQQNSYTETAAVCQLEYLSSISIAAKILDKQLGQKPSTAAGNWSRSKAANRTVAGIIMGLDVSQDRHFRASKGR